MKKALAIIATFYHRIAETPVVKFIASFGNAESGIANTEGRILNEESGLSSLPASATKTAAEESALLAPNSIGKNETADGDDTHSTPALGHSTSNPADAIPFGPSSLPLRSTSERQSTNPRNTPIVSGPTVFETPRSQNVSRARDGAVALDDSRDQSELRVPGSAFTPDFITRAELRHELDSLRRLIESRK